MSANTQIETGERELTITRIFDAPRALVFEAFSKAEHLKRWFAPDGFTVPDCEMDFRVGGSYRLSMRGLGRDHWVHGVYREIVAPERIVWSGLLENEGTEMVTTITFEEHGGKTRLNMHQTFSKETDSTRGAREGWTQTLEHLAEYVATLSNR
jgi:uncharacterized protein YndB with AHSA1/START domain